MDEDLAMNRNQQPANGCASDTPLPVRLTHKELETLHWVIRGKTAWEIARILGRSEAVINFHQGNIRRKFGVCNMRTALVKAIEMGIVSLG
ncbi:helix-turn-helix domain-containing protein [Pseudomonas sp. LJDD11]|uniref:helix-turn-helix domain-containing protein n=1 Tax=Pseudomonas sp. LJDD11 TaxID=2931984 RepID=UPI0027BAC132|nr:helix-turn-helix domain-containing protein [Pseudomonas sp. LJDD11]